VPRTDCGCGVPDVEQQPPQLIVKMKAVRFCDDQQSGGVANRNNNPRGRENEAKDNTKEQPKMASEEQFHLSPDAAAATYSQKIWFREDERWELTWPIWHMLSRQERKDLANKHGYATIGAFEEFMSLKSAVGDSKAYDNSLIYSTPMQESPHLQSRDIDDGEKKLPARIDIVDDDDDDDDRTSVDEKLEDDMESERIASTDRLSKEELLQAGGHLLLLSEEVLHRIFSWLPVDAYATLALVSPHWKSFSRTETVYRKLCERLYLNQSRRRALHVSRFGNSYRNMLENRPRVRAGGGVYVLKYTQVKVSSADGTRGCWCINWLANLICVIALLFGCFVVRAC